MPLQKPFHPMPFLPTFHILLLLLLPVTQIQADQTTEGLTVRLFYDYDCKNKSGILNPASGGVKCHMLEGPTPNSFSISEQTGECSVVFYGDTSCSFNATRAPVVKPLGFCTSSDHLFSFAVECGPDTSTASSATASSQATSSQKASSVSVSASTPEVTSPPIEQSAAPGPGNNGGLSTSGTIAIGVVLPAVSIIVAIIFGIRMWNSGFNSRKANGFTELPMDVRTGNPPPLPPALLLQSDGSFDGFTESGSSPLKTKEAGSKSINPFEPEPPSPINFITPPRYQTIDPGLMSAASINQPRQKQETNKHDNHSITPTGYAELSVGNYSSTPKGAAELSASSSEGFPTTSLFAAQPSRRTDSHSTPRGNATKIPSSPRMGAGQSSPPTGYTELPVTRWEGHNTPAQQGGLAELPAPPLARWR